MKLLAEWKLDHKGETRKIELFWGDLSWLPAEHAVDILVVSAFPNDYLPTPTSLIGALYRNGISVAQLALAKQVDMREEFSCWISEPVWNTSSFRRILCIESGWRGTPPEIADDLFRAIAPSSSIEIPGASMAMPLIGAGDQGYSPEEMMKAILEAAVSWFRRGLNLHVLKIVAYSSDNASRAQKAFLDAKRADLLAQDTRAESLQENQYDFFISYAHDDFVAAGSVYRTIREAAPGARIFFDREITPGTSWLLKIAESLDASRCVVPLYTPRYWKSNYCKDEFTAAFIRQNDTNCEILHPVFYQATPNIPYLFRSVQFIDCRESDSAKLLTACQSLSKIIQ